MKLSETKMSDIDEKQVVQGFILMAKEGMCQQDEILDKMDIVNRHLDELNSELADLQDADERLDLADEETAAATEFALSSPNPDPAHVLDDVFYEGGDD